MIYNNSITIEREGAPMAEPIGGYKTSEKKRASNAKWDKANRTVVGVKVPFELAEQFRQLTAANGETPSQILKAAIDAYIADHQQI